MNPWHRVLIAIPAFVLFVAFAQWAMRGRHEPTGNVGYLGTELAGVEGTSATFALDGVRGSNSDGGGVGALGHGDDGVYGVGGTNGDGVIGRGYFGVSGTSVLSTLGSAGVFGTGGSRGVWGRGVSNDPSSTGVYGEGPIGVSGYSNSGFAVQGQTFGGTGIYGILDPGGIGHAGYFEGRVHVNGTLSKSAGSFRIDHPLDPANRYLSHSFVESPDMKNLYDGVATLGPDGTAVVELPAWFEALNKDYRYQLTPIGEHAPLYISKKIADNRFEIAGGYAGMEVSWMVSGIRRDPYAEKYRIPVEEPKPPHQVGRFMHPELYGAVQR